MVHAWASNWIANCALLVSCWGKHVAFSLLEDPVICTELHAYMHSKKWAMNPKLSEFSKGQMVPAAASVYLQHLVINEMPVWLKRYMDIILFPRIQLKPGKGISLRRRYTMMVTTDLMLLPIDKIRFCHRCLRSDHISLSMLWVKEYHGRCLVLVAHDEMTVQANNGQKKSWVLNGEHPIKKKGAGQGIHCSDVICSTVGWLPDAGQSLEYGKNYEGYWTGELFVKQVSLL